MLKTLLLVCLAGSTLVGASNSLGPRVRGDGYDGILVVLGGRDNREMGVGPETVAKFERALQRYAAKGEAAVGPLPSCPLSEYRRQYWVWEREGRVGLWVHFYHQTTNLVTSGRWLETNILVNDGGDSFFNVRYDVPDDRIEQVFVNPGGPSVCRGR